MDTGSGAVFFRDEKYEPIRSLLPEIKFTYKKFFFFFFSFYNLSRSRGYIYVIGNIFFVFFDLILPHNLTF